ncbi:MAG: TldD/PmbA family protein [Acidobacteriota bacterium]
MDYRGLSQQLVKQCLSRGARAAEVYLEAGRDLTIRVRNEDVESVQESSSHGVGLRILVDGKMGFAYSNDLSDGSLDQAIASAVGFASRMSPDDSNMLPDDPGVTNVPGLHDPGLGRVSMEDKIELIKKVEQLAMGDPRASKSGGSSYGESHREIYLANSNGMQKDFQSSACRYGISVVAEKEDQKSNGSESCARRYYADLLPPESVAGTAVQRAHEMLDPRIVKTQRAAVVFAPETADSLLGGILGAINGEAVLQGASFLREMMEKKIGAGILTLVDDGTRPKGMSSRPFDGEGVPTRKRTIVEQGVLRGFLYNTIVARRAGVQSTGNASRRDYTGLPGIGAHDFYLMAGDGNPEAIIRSTRKGLYLKGATGYGINPVNGNYSAGARGFWIENGAIAFPVKDLTIAGTAAEILNGIDMIGADLDLDRYSAPTFRVKEMQIGGAS